MKKLFISLIFLLCLIMPGLAVFSGCEDGGDIVYIQVKTVQQLKAALTNKIDNDVIVLNANLDLENLNENRALKIESGKNVLDLNGHTITGVDNEVDSWHAIDLRGEETELRIIDSSENKGGAIVGRCYGIQVSRGAKLTIDAGHFINLENEYFNQSVVVYGGTLVVNGGNFTSRVYETIYGKSYTWDEVLYENNIEINGGTFSYIGEEDPDFGMLLFEGDNQTVTINGGTFCNNNISYVVACDSTVNLINNMGIHEDLIVVWEV